MYVILYRWLHLIDILNNLFALSMLLHDPYSQSYSVIELKTASERIVDITVVYYIVLHALYNLYIIHPLRAERASKVHASVFDAYNNVSFVQAIIGYIFVSIELKG